MKKCTTCGSSAQTPYYEDVKNETTQDHASIFRDTQYAAGVVVNEEFQIPAVDVDIQVCVQNLTNVVIGSYLFHPSYGYLKIVHWDSCSGKIGLLNEGLTGTAAPGSVVPECTTFIPSPRPCCVDQDNFSLFPFLAEDFEVPGVGSQVTLQVTSTFGLIQGTIIRIGTCFYYLDTINSSLEIVVTNQGGGCTPGETIEARDVNGDLQYLITSAAVTACTASAVDEGRLIICDGAVEHILDGEFAGQVPVLQDSSTDEVKFELLDAEVRSCTILLTNVNITPGLGIYTLEVEDASVFSIGELLQVNFGTLRFVITNITVNDVDVTTIPNPPGVTINLNAGSAVCKILTTEYLQDQIDSLDLDYLRLDGTNEVLLAVNTLGLDKIQTINTNRLLGRDTVGVGDVEELGVGAGLAFTGSGTIEVPAEGILETMLDPDAATRSCSLIECQRLALATGTNAPAVIDRTGLVNVLKKVMPSDGVVTHMGINFDNSATVSGGNVQILLYVNGIDSGEFITISSGNSFTDAITPVPFAAGDTLSLYVQTNSYTRAGGSGNLCTEAYGHFIEP